ncbi:peptide chain release factor N(5)-glutamine methyltransferase [Candidatus Peregrinibacteria bacterium HGW-Peregrinibacteria-1]|nr:MAG: peptide chain release factor N(5)-glutamine methyltransferase [Candidatus Peregrinibacteria bacterium HGW-Peregrinibacteria-1]
MYSEGMMSIRKLLADAVELVSGRATALLDCELLMMHALGVERESLIVNSDQEVGAVEAELFYSYVRKLSEGMPVEYLINAKEFYGMDFFVDERVLIPRPESELLVDMGMEYLRGLLSKRAINVVDVGTGSGAIIVALIRQLMSEGGDMVVNAWGVDVSSEALEVAKMNAASHGCDESIHFVESDLMAFAEDGEKFDLILANLPYIGEVKHRYISKETEDFEPGIALFGGEDGLELYRRMFEQIKEKGIVFGEMLGEFGFAQADDMRKVLSQYFDDFEILNDLAGIERVFRVRGGA